MHTNGPDQRDCDECKKPLGNAKRITRINGTVVCAVCYFQKSTSK